MSDGETELLEHIERVVREVFHGCAAAAADGDPLALARARAADLVVRIAALLRKLPLQDPGNLRILRVRMARLLDLLEADNALRPELARHHQELGAYVRQDEARELARCERAFSLKAG
jgi:hypothetical protein